MTDISVRKIRRVPFEGRKELIKCLSDSVFTSELKELMKEYPDRDYNDFILIAAENKQTDALLAILSNKKTDIVAVVTAYFTYCFTHYVSSPSYFINTLIKCHYKNPSLPEAVSLIEDYIIAAHRAIVDQFPFGYGALSEITYMLENNVPHCNEGKLIDALLLSLRSTNVLVYVRRYATRLPQQNPLRQRIDNALTVFDIIV